MTTYFECVSLLYRYSPLFTNVDCRTGQIATCSRLRVFFGHSTVWDHGEDGAGHNRNHHHHHSRLERVLCHEQESRSELQPLAPIVVFPEGSTSNGRALLYFTARFAGLPPNQRIHLLGFKYIASDGGFMPTLPLPGILPLAKFFFNLTCQWYNTLQMKWITSASIYASEQIPSLDKDPAELSTALSDTFCALLHTRSVTLGARQKRDFIKAHASAVSSSFLSSETGHVIKFDETEGRGEQVREGGRIRG